MPDPVTIPRDEPLDRALDYAALKAEGTEVVQRLAGDIWTDYNESDPGVTTLEQLCYALTELAYRAELPVEDLLLDRPGGGIHPRRQALYPARRIFPCNPLTEIDIRKLLLDRIPALGNVWLTPHRPRGRRGVNGLYDVALYVPSLDASPCASLEEERELRDRVRRVWCRHRNFCEDLRSVEILRHVPATIHAEVSISDDAAAETVLAQLLFRVANLFAPEPRRRSLKSLIDDGLAPSAIFNGPLLLHGFIDDDELAPKANGIRMPDVIRCLAATPGAIGARNVTVRTLGRTYSGNEWICVPPRDIIRIHTEPEGRSGAFPIRLFRNDVEIRPDAARVRHELERVWAAQRRRFRLAAEYETHFPFPKGSYAGVARYDSVQNQFPIVYGINAYGVEGTAPPLRHAQARQFKGYLLVYDQLMADFFAQLSHLRDLYSTEEQPRQTYFFQTLEKSVPHIEPLLRKWYHEGLARIVEENDPVVARRNRFLDVLLALYGEKLAAASVWDADATRLMHAKIATLRHLAASSHNRGRGLDYMERPSRGNMTGMETKVRIRLGMRVLDLRPLVEVVDHLGIGLTADEWKPLLRHTEWIDEQFALVTCSGEAEVLPVQGVLLPESLLAGGVEEIRIGLLPGETSYAVVIKSGNGWRLAGKYADRAAAVAGAESFAALLRTVERHCQQFYVVEHTLLRFGHFRGERRRDCPFVYDFTATAVFSPPARLRSDDEYKSFVRRIVRENAPAHVVMRDLFLRPSQMRQFEPLYWSWRRALRMRERREIAVASAQLREFLQEIPA